MLLSAAMVTLAVGMMVIPVDAEARRAGGGMNLGKQSSSVQQRQAQQPAQAQRSNQQQSSAQQGQSQAAAGQQRPASGASRWLGPLAGLAAGGLLAAMLFGDGFEGFQIMDFLLIILLAVGAFMLFRMWRRNQARPAMAGAGPGGYPQAGAAYERRGAAVTSPFGNRSGSQSILHPGLGTQSGPVAGDDEAPTWFDGPAFAEGAKAHFIRLQASWDQSDFEDLQEYTTPELFAELKRERQKTEGEQVTEVVRLNSQLVGIRREGDLVVASILFSGLIREDAQGVAEDFQEIWNVQHPWAAAEGNWLIAGIQQVTN
ncbi:Tim44 domain-containing protein [Thiocapsa imhoffii]|nr:Tim44-like domain-containing protein [Thiocapsa imhoffii]